MKIDYENMGVGRIFTALFFPTLLGMLLGSVMNVTDGIFVGRGVNSMALASVNIAAPVFMISTALALTFGIGSTVLASIALSQGRKVDAGLQIRRGLVVSVVVCVVISALLLVIPERVAYLFGATDLLMQYVKPYLMTAAVGVPFYCLMIQGIFVIRMDGSPRYAMVCDMVPALLNIILDYIFIFPLGMGIFGAALASSICGIIGGLMVVGYVVRGPKRFSMRAGASESETGLWAMLRGQIQIGFSGFLGEVAVSFLLIVGNYAFGAMLGEEGIAAYSIACYCTPLMFMLINASGSSAQPIISYDHGAGRGERVLQARRISVLVAIGCAALVTVGLAVFTPSLVGLFMGEEHGPAYEYALAGLPLFALFSVPMAYSVVMIIYYQGIEKGVRATIFTFLRGFVFLFLCFAACPRLFGEVGLWIAVPVAELLTMAVIVVSRRILPDQYDFLKK